MQTPVTSRAFLRATAEGRLHAARVLALVCGLRRGELAGLRWAGVDLDQRTICVVSQRTTEADWNEVTKAPKEPAGVPSTSGMAPCRQSTVTARAIEPPRLIWCMHKLRR